MAYSSRTCVWMCLRKPGALLIYLVEALGKSRKEGRGNWSNKPCWRSAHHEAAFPSERPNLSTNGAVVRSVSEKHD